MYVLVTLWRYCSMVVVICTLPATSEYPAASDHSPWPGEYTDTTAPGRPFEVYFVRISLTAVLTAAASFAMPVAPVWPVPKLSEVSEPFTCGPDWADDE